MDATSPRSAEYDAFGPWVDPVTTPDDVPRLYRDHPLDLAAARLVLKVPRDIARRDATPEMDLYDHLLVLGEDRLTVLSRRTGAAPEPGRGYDVREIPFDRVAGVRTAVDLLDGRLTVHALAGPPVAVRFNGSSGEVVDRFVALLRLLAWPVPASGPAAPALDLGPGRGRLTRRALGEQEIGLVTVYRDAVDAEPGLRTLAAHPRRTVLPRGGPLGRVTHLVRPMTVQAAIVATDGRELQVFGRARFLTRGRAPVHSESRLVVPLDRVTGVAAQRHPAYPDVTVVTLRAGETAIDLPVPAGSDAERVLADVRPPGGGATVVP